MSEMTALMDSSEYQEIQAGARSSGGADDPRHSIRILPCVSSQTEIAQAVQKLGSNYPDLRVMVFEPQSISTSRGGLHFCSSFFRRRT